MVRIPEDGVNLIWRWPLVASAKQKCTKGVVGVCGWVCGMGQCYSHCCRLPSDLPLSLCFPDREACKNIRKPSPTCPQICKGPAFFKLSICFFKTNFQWVYADILVDPISKAVLYFLLLWQKLPKATLRTGCEVLWPRPREVVSSSFRFSSDTNFSEVLCGCKLERISQITCMFSCFLILSEESAMNMQSRLLSAWQKSSYHKHPVLIFF